MIKVNTYTRLAVFVLGFLWIQALIPTWNNHLQVDIWVLWERLSYYLGHNNSFSGLTGNEVLPATLLYLFVPAALIPIGSLSYANYLPAIMLLNLSILGYHWKMASDKWVFLVSLLFFGPILLFRFDGLVTLFLLLGLLMFIKEKYHYAGFWLGLSTGMKVFPIIFLPYLVLILLQKGKKKEILTLLIFFLEALLIPVMAFFLMGGDLEQIASALSFHSHKLISIESIAGSWITGWHLITKGVPPELIPGNGIWAVAGPAAILNHLWIVPVGLAYLAVYLRKSLSRDFDWLVPFTITLIFLMFSKNLNPQYMWWFLAMMPFVKPSKMMFVLVCLAALLNQLVFPLYYTTFVDDFYQQNQSYFVYYLLLARNIILLVVTYMSTRRLLHE